LNFSTSAGILDVKKRHRDESREKGRKESMGLSPIGGIDGMMFSVMPVLVTLVFVAVFGLIIVQVVRGIGQWSRNNASPVLTVDATVVTKRADVTQHHHHHETGVEPVHHHSTTSTSTTYYATFQVASGDRMEFQIGDMEYGMLVEGDVGKLTFQGTRYLGFARGRE
jgi:predicted metalloprotease